MHSIFPVMRAADELAATSVTLTFGNPDEISWRTGNADVTFPDRDRATEFAGRFSRSYYFDPADSFHPGHIDVHMVRVYDVATD